MADVSNEFHELMFVSPPPSCVSAPDYDMGIDFDVLEFPFEELPPAAEAPGATWDVEDVVIDETLCDDMAIDIENLLADMSSGGFKRGSPENFRVPPKKRRIFLDETIETVEPEPETKQDSSTPKPQQLRRSPRQRAKQQASTTTSRAVTAAVVVVSVHAASGVSTATTASTSTASSAAISALATSSTQSTSQQATPIAWPVFLQSLSSSPEWKEVLPRTRVLTDRELDILWYFGTNRNPKGHCITPDYVVALLQIGSWEDQEKLFSFFQDQRHEILHPDTPLLSAGHLRLEIDVVALFDVSMYPPNPECYPRTHCWICKMQTSRSDLHRLCPPCGVKHGVQTCPLTGLC